MHILLPPSEGKSVPIAGTPLELAAMSFPELTHTREKVITALTKLASGPPVKAHKVLGISARLDDERARDANLLSEPTAAAGLVYSGVLYEALDYPSLTGAALKRARARLLISSALFGVLRPTDLIPAYRLSGDTELPKLGTLAALWKQPLGEALAEPLSKGLIVDLRSGMYANHFRLRGPLAERTIAVRVVQVSRTGKRMIVSHSNKATKGRLTRELLVAGVKPRTPAEFIEVCQTLGYQTEISPIGKDGISLVDLMVESL